MPARLDHLVLAVADLGAAVADLAARLGVPAVPGGSHPGRGTHNALLGLAGGGYLEVIAADPDQPSPERPPMFGAAFAVTPRLVAWAVAPPDLAGAAARLGATGRPGSRQDGSRVTPDGTLVRWTTVGLPTRGPVEPVPFLIDWGGGARPGDALDALVRLEALTLTDPDADGLLAALAAVGVAAGDLPVSVARGDRAAISARLTGPAGTVLLV